jgi:hypothetical protein
LKGDCCTQLRLGRPPLAFLAIWTRCPAPQGKELGEEKRGSPGIVGVLVSVRGWGLKRVLFPRVWCGRHLEVAGNKEQGQKEEDGVRESNLGASYEGSPSQVIEWV